jgi:hypothetical protein
LAVLCFMTKELKQLTLPTGRSVGTPNSWQSVGGLQLGRSPSAFEQGQLAPCYWWGGIYPNSRKHFRLCSRPFLQPYPQHVISHREFGVPVSHGVSHPPQNLPPNFQALWKATGGRLWEKITLFSTLTGYHKHAFVLTDACNYSDKNFSPISITYLKNTCVVVEINQLLRETCCFHLLTWI